MVGYGRRPEGLRDFDSEGKVIRGARVGAPGFLRLTTNQDERSREAKPFDMVWYENCAQVMHHKLHSYVLHILLFQAKSALAAQLVMRAHSQKVFNLDPDNNSKSVCEQRRLIAEWLVDEFCADDGAVDQHLRVFNKTLKETMMSGGKIGEEKKRKINDRKIAAAVKKAKSG